MLRLIQNLFGAESKSANRKIRPAKRNQRRVLSLEGLESRNLMAGDFTAATTTTQQFQSVAPTAVTVSIENNDLVIRGTDGADDVKLSTVDGKIVVTITTEVNGRGVSKSTSWRPTGGDVFFYGNKGNDKFTTAMSSGNYLRVTADGGEGNDTLNGSWGKDNLKGGNGDDTLNGHRSHDFLDGGNGADQLNGGDGDDKIYGGTDYAQNIVFGGEGNDTITGAYGSDILHGEAGNDIIDGSYGADDIFGEGGHDLLQAGNDTLRNYLDGGSGNDHIYGSLGRDRLYGRDGDDWLYGGAGNDYLNGGAGADHLYGGTGDDYLYGGSGEDRLYGQTGNDDLDGGAYEESDYVYGGEGVDRFRADPTIHHWYTADYDPPGPGGWNYLVDIEPGEEVYN